MLFFAIFFKMNKYARMSVLFEALHKAANEYRSLHAPVLLPIMPAQSTTWRARRVFVFYVLFGILLLGGSSVLIARQNVAPPQQITQTVKPVSVMAEMQDKGEEGIALPADALISDIEDKPPMVGDVARTLADLPALSVQPEQLVLDEGHADVFPERSSALGEPDAAGRVEAALRQGNWEAARALYDVALDENPDDVAALAGKSFVLEQSGSQEALSEIEIMLEDHPANASLHAAHARLLVGAGQMAEALTAWKRAASLDPRNTTYKLGLAIVHDQLGHEAQALDNYRKVRRSDLSPEAKRRIAYLAARQRDVATLQNASLSVSSDDQEEE